MWTIALLTVLVTAPPQASAKPLPDKTAAQQYSDARRLFYATPAEERKYLRFFSLREVFPEERIHFENAMKFVLPSTSKEQALDEQIPSVKIARSQLWRIDLRDLGWDYRDFIKVMQRYPYTAADAYDEDGHKCINPLVVRADWLTREVSDLRLSDAYNRLLYGGPNIPKNRAEFEKFWHIDRNALKGLEREFLEGNSQVAVNKKRVLEILEAPRGYAWATKDYLKIDDKTDPLEVFGQKNPDGREHIVGIPKVSGRYQQQVAAQVYALFNDKDALIAEATTNLVEDKTKFRHLAAIGCPGSCYQCHDSGGNLTTENELGKILSSGVELWAKKDRAREIEYRHLLEIGRSITRGQEDYTAFVKICNGLSPERNVAAFRYLHETYDADVNLERAAREMYVSVDEFRFALDYWAEHYAPKGQFGSRLASLARGHAIPRGSWEVNYPTAKAALYYWRSRN